MARKLKTYQTSLGFFDQAIAAPSMKAALEAWGADSNLFHQGAASESRDPGVIAATMAKPGIVLKRPVGSNGPFKEHADIPTDLGDDKPAKAGSRSRRKPKKTAARPVDKAAERKAALSYERERRTRERDQAKEEAARQRQHERRQRVVDKAQEALDRAKISHEEKEAAIDKEREAIEEKSRREVARWERERARLESSLRRARDG